MSQQALQSIGGVMTDATLSALDANFRDLYSRVVSPGNVFYCDAVNGSNTTGDGSLAKPFASLTNAYGACVSGHNDTVVLVGDGGTTGTQRVSATFTWAKNATHLLGVCSPSMYSPRARIAPGTSTTAYTPLITLSATGCLFSNVQFWHGFATGTTAQIALNITGQRNVFRRCEIAGMGDDASAQDAGSRCIKFTAAGENLFEDCVIGVDTVTRTAANANVEFATGSARNVFRRCHFPIYGSAGTPIVYKALASGMDRLNIFEDCLFHSATTKSGGAAITALGTLAAATGGAIVLRNCTCVGIGDLFSDATTAAQVYVDGAAPTANTSGLSVNPS